VKVKAMIWSPMLRFPLFIALFAVGYAASYYLPLIATKSNLDLVGSVGAEIGRGKFENVGHPEFAFALACVIVSVALALAFAFLFAHVIAIRLSLRFARREFGAVAPDEKAFLINFSSSTGWARQSHRPWSSRWNVPLSHSPPNWKQQLENWKTPAEPERKAS